MKLLVFCVAAVIILTACGGDGGEKAGSHDELFAYYASLDTLDTTATVTAQYGDRSASFGFTMSSKGGVSTLTLVSPADIEGITVTVDQNGAVVGFDGVAVTAGELSDTGATPAEMLPRLFALWRGGGATETGSEKVGDISCLSAAWVDGGLTWRTWFAADDFRPVAAEVLKDGMRTLVCSFE